MSNNPVTHSNNQYIPLAVNLLEISSAMISVASVGWIGGRILKWYPLDRGFLLMSGVQGCGYLLFERYVSNSKIVEDIQNRFEEWDRLTAEAKKREF